jgi:hypothetical protein
MRAKRNRSAEHLDSDRRVLKRRKAPKNGVPKLGLWEVGIGAVWN